MPALDPELEAYVHDRYVQRFARRRECLKITFRGLGVTFIATRPRTGGLTSVRENAPELARS